MALREDQQVRATAIQAAASFCAPLSDAASGIPDVTDVLFVADVFAAYIEKGWEEALRVRCTSGTEDAHLQVVGESQSIAASSTPAPVTPGPEAPLAPPAQPEPEAVERRHADVIPLEARGVVRPEQSAARKKVDKVRREGAERVVKQARVAKTPEHLHRITTDAEDAGLLGVMLMVDGELRTVKSYLDELRQKVESLR